MNEKKVENIHTKPRGKGQCSRVQTCPEVPLVLFGFLISIVSLSFVDKMAGKKKTHPNQNSHFFFFLPAFFFNMFIHF